MIELQRLWDIMNGHGFPYCREIEEEIEEHSVLVALPQKEGIQYEA